MKKRKDKKNENHSPHSHTGYFMFISYSQELWAINVINPTHQRKTRGDKICTVTS